MKSYRPQFVLLQLSKPIVIATLILTITGGSMFSSNPPHNGQIYVQGMHLVGVDDAGEKHSYWIALFGAYADDIQNSWVRDVLKMKPGSDVFELNPTTVMEAFEKAKIVDHQLLGDRAGNRNLVYVDPGTKDKAKRLCLDGAVKGGIITITIDPIIFDGGWIQYQSPSSDILNWVIQDPALIHNIHLQLSVYDGPNPVLIFPGDWVFYP